MIRAYKPDAVLNVALPYQDLTIMDACLEAGADYIDTANYEAEDTEMIPHGVQSTKRDVKKKALLHISIIPGSGLMMRNLRKQD